MDRAITMDFGVRVTTKQGAARFHRMGSPDVLRQAAQPWLPNAHIHWYHDGEYAISTLALGWQDPAGHCRSVLAKRAFKS